METTTEEGKLQQRVVKTIKLRDSCHGIAVYCSVVSISTGGREGKGTAVIVVEEGDREMRKIETQSNAGKYT